MGPLAFGFTAWRRSRRCRIYIGLERLQTEDGNRELVPQERYRVLSQCPRMAGYDRRGARTSPLCWRKSGTRLELFRRLENWHALASSEATARDGYPRTDNRAERGQGNSCQAKALPMILSKADLKTLTGYVRASAQIRWLTRHGWKFAVNALGDPIVAVAEFERHIVGGKKPANRTEPNWDALPAFAARTSLSGMARSERRSGCRDQTSATPMSKERIRKRTARAQAAEVAEPLPKGRRGEVGCGSRRSSRSLPPMAIGYARQ